MSVDNVRIVGKDSHASYRLFVVDAMDRRWHVWHRFSDFSKLRTKLAASGAFRDPPEGWTPPVLPGKTLRRYLDLKYLTERRDQLDR